MLKIDNDGVNFIKGWELFSPTVYLDLGGTPTTGYGATYYLDGTKVKLGDPPITEEEATNLLINELTYYEKSVNSLIRDDINQHQFNALVSFSYNEGVNALKTSHLRLKINTNPLDPLIKDEFLRWVYVRIDGVMKKTFGLYRRRLAESNLYFKKDS